MPKITQRDLELNWYRINNKAVLDMIRLADEAAYKRFYTDAENKPTLSTLIAQLAELEIPVIQDVPEHYTEFQRLKAVVALLNAVHPVRTKIEALLNLAPVPAPAPVAAEVAEEAEERENERQPLLPPQAPARVAAVDPYLAGFDHMAQKREAAKKNNLKWYLDYQLTLLKKLKTKAWWGKIDALLYGAAVAIAMSGFMLMFMNPLVSGTVLAILGMTAIPLLAWSPAQQNFWITRRDPSELSFDEISPRDSSPKARIANDGWSDSVYHFLNTPVFGFTVKEIIARCGALLNGTVYGGLTACGMWELFGEFGLLEMGKIAVGGMGIVPLGMIGCAVFTLALSYRVFKPELGLGVKFIRDWLDISPIQRLIELNTKVNGENSLDNQYMWRFAALLACIIVGGVFTTLAAGGLLSQLTGIPMWSANLALSMITISIIPFYYQKAIKNVEKAYDARNAAPNPHEPATFSYAWCIRRVNSLVHAVPAFLGGFAMFAAPAAGILFGLFTGAAGFGASYISGENGEEKGYEDKIQTELDNTQFALNDPAVTEWIVDEPLVEVEGAGLQSATKHTFLFRAFHATQETQETELDFLEARPPRIAQG
jgi:hypothetical protein